jgi:asparagine synthase (glutamine-hydrolysing)
MCGICGIIDFAGKPHAREVEKMTERLRHRGPDMGGMHSFPNAVLGHRRLSILDLSDAARQPMLSEDGRTAVVFNGEIYNFRRLRSRLEDRGHRFRTSSDTEVILRLYLEKGEEMLEDLNGMFSLAIWEEGPRKLLLARDRLGKKPLYYYCDGSALAFSSELASLLEYAELPRAVSDQALCEYLLYDFVPAPHTIFEGIFKLPAATKAVYDAGGLRTSTYWLPPEPEESQIYEEAQARLIELLEDAVRLRLISDVPLGAFLSGGIDSTLIASLMQQGSTDRVRTFSISFRGTSHDESPWANLAAESLGTLHREYPVKYELPKIFSRMVRHFGEPFGDSSAIPTWHLSEQTRRHVTVALSGDGGDELFGGYERYVARRFQLVYDRLPRPLRSGIVEPLIGLLPATTDYYGTSLGKKLKLFVDGARRMQEDPLAVVPRTFSASVVEDLTGIHHRIDLDPVIAVARQWMGLDPVTRMLFSDMQTYMAEDILTKVDRMSMAHALEVRSPLLDYRVVELACRMPLSFKLKGLNTKRILRDVAVDRIPSGIVTRSKYGFQVPIGAWFKDDLHGWARDRLFNPEHGYFRGDFVEKLWTEHQQGRHDHAFRIWLLLVFNEWYRQFMSC